MFSTFFSKFKKSENQMYKRADNFLKAIWIRQNKDKKVISLSLKLNEILLYESSSSSSLSKFEMTLLDDLRYELLVTSSKISSSSNVPLRLLCTKQLSLFIIHLISSFHLSSNLTHRVWIYRIGNAIVQNIYKIC